MAIVAPLVALNYSSIYYIIPPLMVFGFSSPVTLTPILPEMGETVNEMVRYQKIISFMILLLITAIKKK